MAVPPIWNTRPHDEAAASTLANELKLSAVTARLLAIRGLTDPDVSLAAIPARYALERGAWRDDGNGDSRAVRPNSPEKDHIAAFGGCVPPVCGGCRRAIHPSNEINELALTKP